MIDHADKGYVFAERPVWCIAAQLYVWQKSGDFQPGYI